MDLPAARLNFQIPEFLLSDMWTLPEKFKNVSLCMSEANSLGDCRFKTEWQYLIHEIRRDGRDVIFCCGNPRRLEYRRPEQYAKAVSDGDIRTVNTFTTIYAVVKRDRDDGSGIADLVLE